MKKHIQRYMYGDAALDERIFATLLTVGVLSSIVTFAAAVFFGLDAITRASVAACTIWFAALQYVSYRRPDWQYGCRVALVCVLNFLIFPLGFFAGGGVDSALPLLYLLGMFNIVALLRPPLRGPLVLLQIVSGELAIYTSYHYPKLLTDLTEQQHYAIAKLFYLIAAATLALMLALMLKFYNVEREHSRALNEKLSVLSTRDPLTGLYNRRELFRRLELVYQSDETRTAHDKDLVREGCYIAMFDVDDFKHLNDTLGHQFGDRVLAGVAAQFDAAVDTSRGELAARYGGEEFVLVLYADSLREAYERLDATRHAIEMMGWEESPYQHVTVSGGVISCVLYDELDRAMHDVDALLYQAKHDGKNCIDTQFHSLYPQKRV